MTQEPRKPRKFIGMMFECCKIYTRIYINKEGTAYVGYCPRCRMRVSVGIDPSRGTSSRFFKVHR